MTALLDVPGIRERVSPLSLAEYHQLGEFNENGRRTELIRGIIIEKMSKSPLHRFITEELRRILESQISENFTVFSQDPITAIDSEPEPDVMVVRGARSDFRGSHPTTAELVVEIAVNVEAASRRLPWFQRRGRRCHVIEAARLLSSDEIDRVKAQIYAEAGVKEYWIVCPEEKKVEVYRQPGAQGYTEQALVAAPGVLECAALSGLRVNFKALFS